MGRSYKGPLLDTTSDEAFTDEAQPCGDGDWVHTGAVVGTIVAICMNQRVTLTRRLMMPGYDEKPGTVVGRVIGASTRFGQIIHLGVELDSGETVAVDVSNPRDWHWEVH